MRSLNAVGLLNQDLTRSLVEFLVKRGYDADDLMKMSSKKGGYRRAVQFICLIAQTCPTLKNKHFLNHVNVFVQNCYKDMFVINQMRLYNALKALTHFKNEKLLNNIRKQTINKSLGEQSNEFDENVRFTAADAGYFSYDQIDSELEEFDPKMYTEDPHAEYRRQQDTEFTVDEDGEFGR